ncbi:MAG: hypothetical protein V3T05_03595 [Myxococcota bacterium]
MRPAGIAAVIFVAAVGRAGFATPPGSPPGSPTDAPSTDAEPPAMSEKDLVEEDDYIVRLSFPTAQDFEVWRNPGIRVQLGYAYGRQLTDGPGPGFSTHTITLRPQVRVSEYWSLAANIGYSIARGDFSGLRWIVSIEPTFHPIAGLGISVGVGYAGIIGNRPFDAIDVPPVGPGRAPAPNPLQDELVNLRLEQVSRTVGPDYRMWSCDGAGAAAVVRAEYLFVVGPLFASGPYIQGDLQRTRCEESTGSINVDTGLRVNTRQWWVHHGWNVGWWLTWR